MLILDPTTIREMKESRNPDAVRTWLDERVAEGFNQKAIQAMLRLPSEELAGVRWVRLYVIGFV